MQLRISTDQPWDVTADVLAIPIVGELALRRPARRARPAERRRARRARPVRRALGQALRRRARRAPASCRSGALVLVAAGDADTIDRETVHRLGATIERRLGGRTVSTAGGLGRRSGRPGRRRRGGRRRAARPRASSRASYEPKAIYLDDGRSGAAGARRADPRRPRRRRQPRSPRPPSAGGSSARARTPPGRWPTAPRTTSARRSSPTRRPRIAKRNGLSIDVISPDKAAKLGMGMFMAVGRGSDNPPRMIVLRSGDAGAEGRARPAPRDRRQGRLLRLRRHLDQASRPDGRDEDGQDRRRDRDRGDRDGRPARARARRSWRSPRRSRTCPARTRPGRATSSGRSTARWSTSRTPTPRAG